MKQSVREWYLSEYPEDSFAGHNILDGITFAHINKLIGMPVNIYGATGMVDSEVRTRVFTELAARMGVDYDEIYSRWIRDKEWY